MCAILCSHELSIGTSYANLTQINETKKPSKTRDRKNGREMEITIYLNLHVGGFAHHFTWNTSL